MDYEVYEPEEDDYYYDQACKSAYSRMFSEGRTFNSSEYPEPDVCYASAS